MFTEEYKGINSFLVGASNLLCKYGVKRETRGNICYELPAPFYFKITEPTARIVTNPCRKWSKTLPYAESLWIASGRNDLDYISYYLGKHSINHSASISAHSTDIKKGSPQGSLQRSYIS